MQQTDRMRGGLAWLDAECGRRFGRDVRGRGARPAQVAILDDIAWPARAARAPERQPRSSAIFRDLVATAFWSSRVGVRDLQYQGNSPVPEWTGCPDAALRSWAYGDRSRGMSTGRGGSASASSAAASMRGFHLQAFTAVRDADVRGVWSPNAATRAAAAALARRSTSARRRPYGSIAEMVADPASTPSGSAAQPRAHRERRGDRRRGRARQGQLRGLACEKPLARNVAEAKRVLELVRRAGIPHGYLENQVFAPQVERGRELIWARGAAPTGRPYLARAAEEHAGPHMPWFWQGALQGGGVLNDMMCHSALSCATCSPSRASRSVASKPVRVTGHIASLKWTRPEYAQALKRDDGRRRRLREARRPRTSRA